MRERIDQLTKLTAFTTARNDQPKRFRGGVTIDEKSLAERWGNLSHEDSRRINRKTS